MKRYILCFIALVLYAITSNLQAQEISPLFEDQVNAQVQKLIVDEETNTLYVTGRSINTVGSLRRYGTLVDSESGALRGEDLQLNGRIYDAVADENGGLYIAGMFTEILGQERDGLAYIDSNGNLGDFFAGREMGGQIANIEIIGDDLIVSGYFSTISAADAFTYQKAIIEIENGEINTTLSEQIPESYYHVQSDSADGFYILELLNFDNSFTEYAIGHLKADGTYTLITDPFVVDRDEGIGWFYYDKTNEKIYLFGRVASLLDANPVISPVIEIQTDDATISSPIESMNNNIESAVSDGNGGWYVAGGFSEINGQNIRSLAYISGDGNVTEVHEDLIPPGNIHSLDIKDSLLYVASNNTALLSQELSYNYIVMEIINEEGELIQPVSIPNRHVNEVLEDGNGGFFVCGNFSRIGSKSINGIAHFDEDGILTDWNPEVNGQVLAMAANDTALFIGGAFNSVGGVAQSAFAVLDKSSGELEDWNPNFNNYINELKIHNDTLYVGGNFVSVDGVSRSGLAMFGIETQQLIPNYLDVKGTVAEIEINDEYLLVAGSLEDGSFLDRRGIAGYNRVQNSALTLPDNFNITAGSNITIKNDTIFLSGSGTNGNFITALTTNFDQLSFEVGFQGTVNDLTIYADNLVVTGQLSDVNGKSRNVAFFDLETLELLPQTLERNLFSNIHKINDQQYLRQRGTSTSYNSRIARNKVFAVNLNTNKLSPWDPSVTGYASTLRDMKVTDRGIALAGVFYVLDGQEVYNFGIVDPLQGDLVYSTDQINRSLFTFEMENNLVWFGSQGALFLFDMDSEQTLWEIPVNRDVELLEIRGDTIFAAGNFNTVNGEASKGFFAANKNTGVILDFDLDITGNLSSLIVVDNDLYISGAFTSVFNEPRRQIAGIDLINNELLPWDPTLNNPATVLEYSDGKLLAGGSQVSYSGGTSILGSFCYDMNSGEIDDYFIPEGLMQNPYEYPRVYYPHEGKLYLAFSGGMRELRRLDLASQQFDDWKLDISQASVQDLVIKDGIIYAGGTFNTIHGTSRKNIAAVRISDQIVLPFNPAPDYAISQLELIGDTLVYAGRRNGGGIPTISRIGAHNIQNGSAVNLNISAGDVYNMQSHNDSLYIHGSYLESANEAIPGLVFYDLGEAVGGTFGPVARNIINWAISGNNMILQATVNDAGDYRQNLAAINRSSGELLPWNPRPVNASLIKADENTLYVGGVLDDFSQGINAFDWTTKTQIDWQPGLAGSIYDIETTEDWVYVSGQYLRIDNQNMPPVVRLDKNTALADDWGTNISGLVSDILPLQDEVVLMTTTSSLVANGFTGNLVSVDIETGTTNTWTPSLNGIPNSLTYNSDTLYISGSYFEIGDETILGPIAYKYSEKSLLNWRPASSQSGKIWTAGEDLFLAANYNGITDGNLLIPFDLESGDLKAFDLKDETGKHLTAYGVILDLVQTNEKIIAAGSFQINNNNINENILVIDKATGVVTTPINVDGSARVSVTDLEIYKDTLIISGQFEKLNDVASYNLGLFKLSSNEVIKTDLKADNAFPIMKLHNDTLYLSGYFPHLHNQNKLYFQSYSLAAGQMTNITLPLEGPFLKFDLDENHIYGIETQGIISQRDNLSITKYEKTEGANEVGEIHTGHTYNYELTDFQIEGNALFMKGVAPNESEPNIINNLTVFDKITGEELPYYDNIRSGFLYTWDFSENYAFFGGRYHINDSPEDVFLSRMPLLRTWYADPDGDGYGDLNDYQLAFTRPEGYAPQAGDCTPDDPDIYPGAPALPDGKDNNCDGVVSADEEMILSINPEGENQFRLFPNPATQSIQILSKDPIFQINLYDSFGRWIEQWEPSNSYAIDHLSFGMYILKVQFAKKEYTYKLIKK